MSSAGTARAPRPPKPGRRSRPALTIGRAIGQGLALGFFLLVLALASIVVVIPSLTGSTPLTVLTGSMEPNLPPGTLLVVSPVDPDDLKLGDVVTYQIESGKPDVISHRVIEILANSDGSRDFITKGDNNPSADLNPVVEDQIKGRLWYSVPLVGWLSTGIVGVQRTWLIPVAGALLLGFGALTVLRGFVDSARTRKTRAPLVSSVSSPAARWTVGERLRRSRELAQLRQEELGELLGCSRERIWELERDVAPASSDMFDLWALATGTPVEWLLSGQYPAERVTAAVS